MRFVHTFVEADASVAATVYGPAAMIVCAVARPLASARLDRAHIRARVKRLTRKEYGTAPGLSSGDYASRVLGVA